MLGLHPMELMIVGIVALLLFGKRLPEVARSLGKGITEFKKGIHGIDEDTDRAASSTSRPSSRPMAEDRSSETTTTTTAPKFEPPKFEPSESNS